MLKAAKWVDEHVSDLTGKIFVVTGSNTGIGLEIARLIAYRNGKVIMACRNESKTNKAIDDMVNGTQGGAVDPNAVVSVKVKRECVEYMNLDLADLRSIDAFSNELNDKYPKIDCLICNAGIMIPDTRLETAQGMEMQMGVNVFGHYALICKLLPNLKNAIAENGPKPRVVLQGSLIHSNASSIDFADIDHKKSYSKWSIYAESKLGTLLLMHKFAEMYPQFDILGSHPGHTLTKHANGLGLKFINLFAQSAVMGALPAVMAATNPTLKSNAYVGPQWVSFGYPTLVSMSAKASDKNLADQLFQVCQEKTSVAAPAI